MKGMAAVVATAEEALRPVRDRRLALPERAQPAVPPPEPPETKPEAPGTVEPTIYRFILRYSLPQQIVLPALTLPSFPFLYYSIELP